MEQSNISNNNIIENEQINKELSLDLVNWKPNYILAMASIGQIMVSFSKIKNLVPKNTYEIILYEKLNKIVHTLLIKYNNLLKYNSNVEREVKYYNLIVDLPKNTFIDDNDNIYLKNAKIGKLVNASKQRINFILNRDIPMRYKKDILYEDAFIKMRDELKEFLNTMNDFEKDFVNSIDEAKKAQFKENNIS